MNHNLARNPNSDPQDIYMVSFLYAICNIPITILLYTHGGIYENPTTTVELFGVLLSVLSLLNETWLNRKYLQKFWYFTLTYCLPFINGFVLLVSIYNPLGFIISYFLSIMLLILLVEKRFALILTFIGSISSYIAYKAITAMIDDQIISVHQNYAIYSSLVLLCIVFFLLSKRRLEEKNYVIQLETFARAIAHETIDPLAYILMKTEQIQEKLKSFEDNNKPIKIINSLDLENVKSCASAGIRDTKLFLASTSDIQSIQDFGYYWMKDTVKYSLKSYYVSQSEKRRIKIHEEADFKFYGSKELFKHLLLNLLKNVFRHAGKHAEIKIFIQNRKLIFEDNGVGIIDAVYNNLFKKYTSGGNGTGVGLSFCKAVMELFNGEISCESEIGSYTRFRLHFPEDH